MKANSGSRRYTQTHPWISFDRKSLLQAGSSLWLKLGEAGAKCELVSGIPLPPAVASHLGTMYLVKGVLGTTAIEGNTLTQEQVKKVLEGELELPKSKEYLAKEATNVGDACGYIVEHSLDHDGALTPKMIREFNAMILEGLKLPEEVQPGIYRRHSVEVARYLGAPYEDCEFLVLELCKWINSFDLPGLGFAGPILKAIVAHLYIAWIHPFGDGNGRTARLVEYYLLTSGRVPLPAAHLMSNHYNITKTEYLRQLHEASRSGGNIVPFVEYALEGFVDGLNEQLDVIRMHQFQISWRDLTRELLGSASKVSSRRHELLMGISWKDPLTVAEIVDLSPWLARTYGNKDRRMLNRDLEFLKAKGWVEDTPEGLRARTEILSAFVPSIPPKEENQLNLEMDFSDVPGNTK